MNTNFSIGNYRYRRGYNRVQMGSTGSIVVGLIVTIIGVALLGVGMNIYFDQSKKAATYKEAVGTVVDVDRKEDTIYNSDLEIYETDITYRPIYEYKVNNVAYRYESATGSSVQPTMGSTTTIKYDPANPSNAFIPGDSEFVMLVVGALFLIIGLFVTVTGFIKRNKEKSEPAEPVQSNA